MASPTHTTQPASCDSTSKQYACAHGVRTDFLRALMCRPTQDYCAAADGDTGQSAENGLNMELGTYRQNFAHIPLSVGLGAAHVPVRVFGSFWAESPTKAVHRWHHRCLAKIGALELHEFARWHSVHRQCLLSTTGRAWYCFHDCKSFLKVRQPVLLLYSLLTHSFCFCSIITSLATRKDRRKKIFIKHKQDVSPSRASPAKQRTEWGGKGLHTGTETSRHRCPSARCKVSSVPSDDTQPHLVLSISQGELNKIAKRRTEITPMAATGASFAKQGNTENDLAKTESTKC